ncbi:Gfo/Idh/MocA family oxidoreductase [Acidothermaceae bacterium B102]|nr:Gfo/Idh/MocA family oxidoreductase [Acidothermaceae bacterium B102]
MTFPTSLPVPRTLDPKDAPSLRWGILATGWIAERFVDSLRKHTSQQVVAVGSRSKDKAATFASQWGIAAAYGSYEELVADPDVDVVYVATPHSEHHANALLAIAAGKHVLVEKAFTRNAAEAREVIDAARAAGVFLQEAMWTRYLPRIDVVRQLLEDGVLGDLASVVADHGQYMPHNPEGRMYNPALAGGALLDLGVYPVSFSSFVLGKPSAITVVGTLTDTGVDGHIAGVLQAPSGAQALIDTTLLAKTPTIASISGSDARIELSGDFYNQGPVVLISRDGDRLTWDVNPIPGHEGLCYQGVDVARRISEGALESALLPLSETLSIMETMDEIRRQVGVVYPGE